MKWIIKETKDEDGLVVSREIKGATNAAYHPYQDYILVNGPDSPRGEVKIDVDDSGEADVVTVVEDLDKKAVKAQHSTMDTTIISDAAAVFGTTRLESLLAFTASYHLKMTAPEKYINQNLTALKSIGTFTQGDALDTADKIRDYYKEVLVELDIKRDTAIKDYLVLKASKGL